MEEEVVLVEVEEVVREERRWNVRLFWQSSRTATTELMARERRRWLAAGRWMLCNLEDAPTVGGLVAHYSCIL